ncbi:hypothetical protein FHS80_001203 [Porphyromonas circumdentaria]|nr:hypothetical protein [Porphyromonas circumdentaria]
MIEYSEVYTVYEGATLEKPLSLEDSRTFSEPSSFR